MMWYLVVFFVLAVVAGAAYAFTQMKADKESFEDAGDAYDEKEEDAASASGLYGKRVLVMKLFDTLLARKATLTEIEKYSGVGTETDIVRGIMTGYHIDGKSLDLPEVADARRSSSSKEEVPDNIGDKEEVSVVQVQAAGDKGAEEKFDGAKPPLNPDDKDNKKAPAAAAELDKEKEEEVPDLDKAKAVPAKGKADALEQFFDGIGSSSSAHYTPYAPFESVPAPPPPTERQRPGVLVAGNPNLPYATAVRLPGGVQPDGAGSNLSMERVCLDRREVERRLGAISDEVSRLGQMMGSAY